MFMKVKSSFAEFTSAADGTIGVDELLSALTNYGTCYNYCSMIMCHNGVALGTEKLHLDDAQRLIAQLEIENGRVNYKDYVEMMMKTS